MSGMQSCLSNVMQVDVSENFQFFLYSVAVENDQGEQIESRHRRKFLFDLGLWNGLLKDMPEKEKDDLRRVVFFQGSFSTRHEKSLDWKSKNFPWISRSRMKPKAILSKSFRSSTI